jgi:hypothetical protein
MSQADWNNYSIIFLPRREVITQRHKELKKRYITVNLCAFVALCEKTEKHSLPTRSGYGIRQL